MTAPPTSEALKRVEDLLFEMQVLESFIARREAGAADGDQRETAAALVDELFRHQAEGGSWGESLRHTAEALLLLSELRPFDADISERVARAIAWLRSRQRAAGAFAEECEADAHARGFCPHFATGFFSPGPRTQSFAGTLLSNGARFGSDEDARLGLSAQALRALIDYVPLNTDDGLQLDALRRLAALLFREDLGLSMPASISVLATLAHAPRTPGQMAVVHGAFSRLAGIQRADGSWPGAEPFHVAEAFLLAVQAGYGSPMFDAAIARTADMLVLSQQSNGSWGQGVGPYRLLTAWRTLRYVSGIRPTRSSGP